MFSLIISIISIALVAALAVATIYFGGSQLTKGTAKAKAAKLVTAGQQVAGAVAVAQTDGANFADGLALTGNSLISKGYLSAPPAVADIGTASLTASNYEVALTDKEVCDFVATVGGGGGGQYACAWDTTNSNGVFSFKL